MSTARTFRFEFTVSNEFAVSSPVAEQWIAARQAQIMKQRSVRGPRGGLYRLDPAEPLVWRSSRDGYHDFMMNLIRWGTTRTGRYVRPDRITPDLILLPDLTLEAFTLPVQEGIAVLPDGRKVETPSRFVVVPVPPS